MDTLWVDAAPFRRHVQELSRGSGLDWRLIAAHADVAPRAIRALLTGRVTRQGRRRHLVHIHVLIGAALMTLDLDDLQSAEQRRVCAGETRRLLQTLHSLDPTSRVLSNRLTPADLELQHRTDQLWCSAGTRARVQAAHDLLTDLHHASSEVALPHLADAGQLTAQSEAA